MKSMKQYVLPGIVFSFSGFLTGRGNQKNRAVISAQPLDKEEKY